MSQPARHLKVVEFDDSGNVIEPECPACQSRLDEIAGLERDLRGWMVRYRELERDRAAEAREHPMWPVAHRVFNEWRLSCKHPKSVWTPDRFWLIEPFLTNPRYGKTDEDRIALCRRAVAGAAFDAHAKPRRNGSIKRYDDWDLIFRGASKFEEFCNRAPRGWAP